MESDLYQIRSLGGCTKAAYELFVSNIATILKQTWLPALLVAIATTASLYMLLFTGAESFLSPNLQAIITKFAIFIVNYRTEQKTKYHSCCSRQCYLCGYGYIVYRCNRCNFCIHFTSTAPNSSLKTHRNSTNSKLFYCIIIGYTCNNYYFCNCSYSPALLISSISC